MALSPSETARLLAGMPVDAEAAAAVTAPGLSRYTSTVDSWWRAFDERIGDPMTEWALAELDQTDGTVFYPFAGADFTTIHRFYPGATRYVLVALEPAGRMPDLTRSQADTETILEIFTGIMQDFQRRGYYITAELGEQFGRQRTPLEGITPVLAMSAEREGFEVRRIAPIWLNDDGSDVVEREDDLDQRRTWRSVRIELVRRSDDTPVVLDYLRLDLSDSNLNANPAQANFVQVMSAHPVLLKAASYLLQYNSFSVVREAILSNAPAVVQDDSGVDYDVLSRHFEVRIFGRFERPHYEFSETLQQSLARAYAESGAARLPFRFGYWKDGLWCLQHAHTRR